MYRPILLVGEAYGEEEDRRKTAFVGPSGRFLNWLLSDAGIEGGRYMEDNRGKYIDWSASHEVYPTNCFNLRPRPTNNISNLCGPRSEGIVGLPALEPGLYLRREYQVELDRLWAEIERIDPNIIIALGNTALLILTGSKLPITKNRGSLTTTSRARADGTPWKVLPTFHPANVIRERSQRPIVIADLMKAKRHAAIPKFTRPSRNIWVEPTLEDLTRFELLHIRDFEEPCAVDIETARGTITEIGFAPSRDEALVVPFYSRTHKDGNYWRTSGEERTAWLWVARILRNLRKPIFHNGLYDIYYLWRAMQLPVPFGGEDTMLLHHSLQPEMKKALGFLATIYTEEPSWKFMRKEVDTTKTED
jgi:DNA polymerase